ncbi:hypothetical protein CLOM_g15797, partial [Closterium sp. NIES-68]
LFAVKRNSGEVLWTKRIGPDYGVPNNYQGRAPYCRSTPTVVKGSRNQTSLLIIGIFNPAFVLAVRRSDGELVWKTLVDPHPAALITASGTVYRGGYINGVSSAEEIFAVNPNYPCCTFIGSVVKLDVATGQTIWQTYTLPANGGNSSLYAGGAIWGGSPSIDRKRQLVFVATGNNYRVPASVSQCQQQQLETEGAPVFPDPCVEAGNYFDSVLALDIAAGSITWAKNLSPIDAFTIACVFGASQPNCPPNPGEDYDFGMAPLLLSVNRNTNGAGCKSKRDLAVIGQKSGVIWALDRADGQIVWSTAAGPGGALGGSAWGIATDLQRVYISNENSEFTNFTLLPSGNTTTHSAWVALDPATGQVLWSQENPNFPALAMLPSVANGVMFGTSMDAAGHVYAFDAASGNILWSFSPGASVHSGVSIDRGCIFFGKGYRSVLVPYATGGGPQRVYAFCVPGGK